MCIKINKNVLKNNGIVFKSIKLYNKYIKLYKNK